MRRAVRIAAVLGLAVAAGCGPAEVAGAPQPPPGSVAPAVRPVVVDPVVPGWSPVRSADVAAVYDAPPNWVVYAEGHHGQVGEAAGQPVLADAVAELRAAACDGFVVAQSGLMYETGTDPAAAARDVAKVWGHHRYLDSRGRAPELDIGAPAPLTTLGGQPATVVEVAVRTASPIGPCRITRASAYAVAAAGYSGKLGPIAVLVVITDLGRADTVPEAEVRRMLGTLRPG